MVTTTRSAATIPGPMGPPSPRIVSAPPITSANAATYAQKIPGRRPRPWNQPATPGIEPPLPTTPNFNNPCGTITTPTATRTLLAGTTEGRQMNVDIALLILRRLRREG